MSVNKALLTSNTDNWETPADLFARLDDVFHFDLDVCATDENAKCQNFYAKEDDGLAQEWKGTCWMNPPYGRTINKWVEKAYHYAKYGGVQPSPYFRPGQIRAGSRIMY